MSVTTTLGWRISRRQAATRRSMAAGPCRFSGLPGETSHQTRSSPSARSAQSVTCTWPACGGSNDPPSSPMRWPAVATGPRMRSPRFPAMGHESSSFCQCRIPARSPPYRPRQKVGFRLAPAGCLTKVRQMLRHETLGSTHPPPEPRRHARDGRARRVLSRARPAARRGARALPHRRRGLRRRDDPRRSRPRTPGSRAASCAGSRPRA